VLGAPPTIPGSTAFQLLVNTQGRLTTEEEFCNIIVRAAKDGELTRVRDVGRVELGSSTYACAVCWTITSAAAIPISSAGSMLWKRPARSGKQWSVKEEFS